MKKTTSLPLRALLFSGLAFAACGKPQPPASVAGAISASPAVQRLGVDSYLIGDSGARLYKAGSQVGLLSIAAAISDQRTIVVTLDDGRGYSAVVDGRDEAGFHIALGDTIPVQAFQTDPALAPLLARYDMSFPLATGTIPAGLQPEKNDQCPEPVPSNGCILYTCAYTSHTWSNITRINTNGAACPANTKVLPSTSGVACTENATSGSAGCSCGLESFTTTADITCPPLNSTCISLGQCDHVIRNRTCTDPGATCSTATSTQSGCTTQPPVSGSCLTAGNAYTLTVTKVNGTHGTVTSDDGAINCGSTCSATELAGNVLTLTATPNQYDTFTGWSGACTGIGTCTVTLSAATSVTATFAACVPNCGGVSCGGADGCGGQCTTATCGSNVCCDRCAGGVGCVNRNYTDTECC